MAPFDLNIILIPLLLLLGTIAMASGFLVLMKSFFGFRAQVNRAMNMDLEVIRVSKFFKRKDEMAQGNQKEQWQQEIGAMEQLLTTLAGIKERKSILAQFLYGQPHFVLEIVNPAKSEEIYFYISIPKKFSESIEKQVNSYFPNALLEKVSDYTIFTPGSATSAAELVLKNKHALPIKTYMGMNVDPLNELTNSLSKLETDNEGGVIQLVAKPAGNEWRKLGRSIAHKMQQGKQLKDVHSNSIMGTIGREVGKGVTDVMMSSGKDQNNPISGKDKTVQLTPEEQDVVKAIEGKSSKTGFYVNVRLLASAPTQERADQILAHLENAFSQFENPATNNFTVKRRTKSKKTIFNYIFRSFDEENAVILNTEELSSIFHLPISTTETPKIKWLKAGSAPPPIDIPKEGLILGYNDYRGAKVEIRVTDDDRRRHLYTIGQTGTGKSTFLQELAKQDARNGKGFCVIDPHGDFAEDVLTAIPKERAEDVIYFNPADTERPFGLNMMEYDPARPEQKTFIINEMIGIFDQLYDLKQTGGPMFEQYMRNAMLLVMEDPESGSTLMEIPKVLSDEDFRRLKISKCNNPTVVDFWTKEAEKAGGEAALANMVPYITSKLTTFISNDMMRPIIAQQKSTINFRQIMDEGKILIVNLSKGRIGEINARLLGMVIVGRILMSALSRVDMPESERKDFYLYMDEFQNVTTESISQILSEARKYHLCLILAHQFIAQLKEEISKAVFGNVGSICAFRVGAEDAEFLEKQFAPIFTMNDLVNVDNRNLFAKVLINNELSKPFNMKTYPPTKGDQELANAFKELSRLKFGRDAKIVNAEIMNRVKLSRSADV